MIKILLGIDGMMCGMCEAHINEALRTIAGVKKVASSYKKGETVIIAEKSICEEALRTALEKDGYKLISFREEPYEKKGLLASIFGKH